MSRSASPHRSEELRRHLRQWRNTLTPEACRRASLAVCARLVELQVFLRARHIAAYIGSRGEIDPMPLLHLAHAMGKACYLPVLHPFLPGRLWFVRWTPTTLLTINRFGIPEPVCDHAARRRAQWLDLVLMPLLGFDHQCNRLGMGGGYYDRTFAFRRWQRKRLRPVLIGLAHDEQRCSALSTAPWDVRADMVVTPTHRFDCRT